MIRTETSISIYCDADLPQLELTESPRCGGTTGRYDTQAKALDTAKREGFKPHKDGKHHLCQQCAAINPEAVVA